MQSILALCKSRGFVFQGSEIYHGLTGSFDYGPLGVALKNSIKTAWWDAFIAKRPQECFGLETGILLSPRVWEASGHVSNFTDPLSECELCNKRVRADHQYELLTSKSAPKTMPLLKKACQDLQSANAWVCPCEKKARLREPREFNLLFSTVIGPTASAEDAKGYLRPETAQGTYINLNNVAKVVRKEKFPFGIGQIGIVFRNEVSPRDYIFRTREFEQLELQWFCDAQDSQKWHEYWVKESHDFLIKECGLNPTSLRIRQHEKEELAHYALATSDLEFQYPFGWGEMWGIANRGDHDLKAHASAAKVEFMGNQPCHIIEPSLGLNRLFLALLCDAYTKDEENKRTLLRFSPNLAPVQLAVFPIVSNKIEYVNRAREVFDHFLSFGARVDLDTSSAGIGKKYRRYDEIGTPLCVVIDDKTFADHTVSVRDRDSMKQIRIQLSDLQSKKQYKDICASFK